MSAERGHPPSRPQPGPPPARGGPRRLSESEPGGTPESSPARGGPRRLAESAPDSPPKSPPARDGHRGAVSRDGIDPVASRGPRRLAKPKPVRVRADDAGRPKLIGNREVDAVRESWLVEDRWWTDAPLRRRYWEGVTADGRDVVVFRDLQASRWYTQR